MRNEDQAIEEMEEDEALRKDLFSISQTVKSTGLSRALLLKLEDAGFLVPKKKNDKTGYRYYDTFNIHKILEYKRLRFDGLSQSEVFAYYDANDESELLGILDLMRKRQRLLMDDIEALSLRLEKHKRNYNFSFYDYDRTLCLVYEGDFLTPMDTMTAAYNHSVEIISRGLMTSITDNMFTIRHDTKEAPTPYHMKICFPIEQDVPENADLTDIEWIPGCHTYSMLFYGLEGIDAARMKLWDRIDELHLTPLSDEMRTESIVAPYVNMHVSPECFLTRFAVPVKEEE